MVILYAVLISNCVHCKLVTKYLKYLESKLNLKIFYYTPKENFMKEIYIRNSDKNQPEIKSLKFPKIYYFNKFKTIDITSEIISDSFAFYNKSKIVKYDNLTFIKFIKNFLDLKNLNI